MTPPDPPESSDARHAAARDGARVTRVDEAATDAVRLALADEAATDALAAHLTAGLAPGLVVWLSGTLGAGKTTLVRGMLRSLGYNGRVRSPSFTLLEPYNLPRFPVYHFDFYRFSSGDEWRDAGFDEYFGADGACLVEWPERAAPHLPAPDLHLLLEIVDGDGTGARLLHARAHTDAGRRCLMEVGADS